MSAGRQYYDKQKRHNETPLEYSYCLDDVGMCAKIQVQYCPLFTCREHVKLFIETLDDRNLAKQLTLLCQIDVDVLDKPAKTIHFTEIGALSRKKPTWLSVSSFLH